MKTPFVCVVPFEEFKLNIKITETQCNAWYIVRKVLQGTSKKNPLKKHANGDGIKNTDRLAKLFPMRLAVDDTKLADYFLIDKYPEQMRSFF